MASSTATVASASLPSSVLVSGCAPGCSCHEQRPHSWCSFDVGPGGKEGGLSGREGRRAKRLFVACLLATVELTGFLLLYIFPPFTPLPHTRPPHFISSLQVRIPHTNWSSVFDSNAHGYQSFLLSKGYERIYLPEGLKVWCWGKGTQGVGSCTPPVWCWGKDTGWGTPPVPPGFRSSVLGKGCEC